jgi:hypothetical protein
MRGWYISTRGLAVLLIALLAFSGPVFADDPSARAKVARRKALFVEQFTRLVEWPAASLPRDGSFVLCLQGTSETADELGKLAAIRRFKDRLCEVRRPRAAADLAACHVLYLASSEAARLAQTLAAAAGRPLITVSDTPGFAARGVEFNLFEEEREVPQPGVYVGFELNVATVKRSVLTFDPRLLTSAARRVGGTP